MKTHYKYRAWAWFVGGLLLGAAVFYVLIDLGGYSLVSQQEWSDLRRENNELTEELLRPRDVSGMDFSVDDLPYDGDVDARAAVAGAREAAQAQGRYLMVTFGANWCLDCRMLYHNLNSQDVAGYARDVFAFVNVDVGKFNQNRDVAEELGVELSRGIPVAIFFDPAGQVIGTTNEGQLEPARLYSSKQILKFVRDVAERSRIIAPDAVD